METPQWADLYARAVETTRRDRERIEREQQEAQRLWEEFLRVQGEEVPEGDRAVMPDVTGKTLRQALAVLASYDLDVSVAGRGVVVRQSPVAGAPLTPGGVCRLELIPPALARLD